MKKKIVFPIIMVLITLLVYASVQFIYFSPIDTAIKIDKIKISNALYKEVLKETNDITLANKHFVDNVILSEIAIEIGLDEHLKKNDKSISFNRRLELVAALKAYYKQIKVVTDDDVLEIYNERYKTFYEYIAIETTKELEDLLDEELDSLKTSTGTIEDLNNLNIVTPNVFSWYQLPKNDNFNRFIHITKELPIEKTFEDAKTEIVDEIKEQFANQTLEKLLDQSYLKYTIFYYKDALEN